MPDYSKLHQWTSHRVRIEYDTGASITGYLASCQPGQGQVEFVKLQHVELISASGKTLESMDHLVVCPNAIVSMAMDEGPRGA